jgi:hypothetical protein
MKKIFAYQVILLLLSLSFVVSSCGDDEENLPGVSSGGEKEPINTITEEWFFPITFTYNGFKYKASDEQTARLCPESSYQDLHDVVIPQVVQFEHFILKVVSIGGFAFERCLELKTVFFPESIIEIGVHAFEACIDLEQVHLGNGVKEIGEMAFVGCQKLQSISIPDGVTTIHYLTFKDCEKLEQIEIPQNLSSIEFGAFYGCKSLRKIELPKTIKEIGDRAFGGCTSLESFVCGAQQPPTLGTDVFKDVNLANSTLYVPSGSVDIYKAADQWKEFGTILAKEN